MNIALIVAAGSSIRMRKETPKQFLLFEDKPLFVYSALAFNENKEIDSIVIVTTSQYISQVEEWCEQYQINKVKYVVKGGQTRQESVYNGLLAMKKIAKDDDIVLIHDAIRPMISQEIISDCIVKTKQFGNAITCIPCAEAMIQTEDGFVSSGSYPRDKLKRTQTPQGFKLGDICNLHREALEKGITNSVASCTLMIELNKQIHFSVGSEKNIKLTTVEDLDIFKALLASKRDEWLK